MFKKFSYLASVSVLSSAVMVQASHAMYTDHDHVLEVIDSFYAHKAPKSQVIALENSDPQEDVSTAWSVLNTIGSTAYSVGSTVAKPLGNTLRWTGEQIRGDAFVGNLLASKGLDAAKGVTVGGVSAKGVLEQVENTEGVLPSARLVTGNVIRSMGAYLAGETPTLEREIRKLWIDNKYGPNPEDALTSTACALYLSPHMKGVDQISQTYRNVVESWNGSSYTTKSADSGLNLEYFLRGLVRAYVIRGLPVDKSFASQVFSLNVDLGTLPATKSITSAQVIENNKEIVATDLESKLKELRQTKLLEYVQNVYNLEMDKHQANEARQRLIANNTTTTTTTTIENGNSEPNLAMSMIEYKRDNSDSFVESVVFTEVKENRGDLMDQPD